MLDGENSWIIWAILSAVFAAATAILAKIGVSGVNSDFATLIRTLVVVVMLVAIVCVRGAAQPLASVGLRTYAFLGISGLATGASWLCYFRALQLGDAARVAPLDKLSVVFVAILGTTMLGESLGARGWAGIGLIATGALLVAMK